MNYPLYLSATNVITIQGDRSWPTLSSPFLIHSTLYPPVSHQSTRALPLTVLKLRSPVGVLFISTCLQQSLQPIPSLSCALDTLFQYQGTDHTRVLAMTLRPTVSGQLVTDGSRARGMGVCGKQSKGGGRARQGPKLNPALSAGPPAPHPAPQPPSPHRASAETIGSSPRRQSFLVTK